MLTIFKNNSKINALSKLVFFIILGGVVSICRGQNSGWDLINYHIYNVWSLINHRNNVDIFASGVQGTFSPYLDFIYYWIGFKSLNNYPFIVAFLAGIPYGFLLWISWKSIRLISAYFTDVNKSGKLFISIIALAVAATGAFVWSQIGTTSNEVFVSVLTISGFYLMIKTYSRDNVDASIYIHVLAGALLGSAAGLKLTAAIYAPGLGIIVFLNERRFRRGLISATLFSLGWLLAFSLLYGPWAIHLYHVTGNPFYPMFNGIFHSPLSAPHGGRDIRFIPKNIWQWIFFPFYWLDNSRPIANTLAFRDTRYAFVYTIYVIYFIRKIMSEKDEPKKTIDNHKSIFTNIVIYVLVSYLCWMLVFSMLRYSIVIEILGVASAIFICFDLARRALKMRLTLIPYTTVILVGLIMISTTSIPDWGHINIGKKVFTANVPQIPEHSLIILSMQPMGLLAPLINDKNPTSNYIGLPKCFAKDGWCINRFYKYGIGTKIRTIIQNHDGPIFVARYTNRNPALPQLQTFHLASNANSCLNMTTNMTPDIVLCRVYRVEPSKITTKIHKYKLSFVTNVNNTDDSIKPTWLVNSCSTDLDLGKLHISWNIQNAQGGVMVYVSNGRNKPKNLFASGQKKGNATTGKWVRSGQYFTIEDKNRRVKGTVAINFQSCE